ncbi:PhzF family phenazine biosynthesis protein [Sciscionella marina]|uniref:PhzF family phenazine biosynthesis protein n=1 Tax=Sciscionella marina TaxID=508770 RepID=UPI0003A04000|nr:PhzF family phenazine biosynthesis protein [Sciscionella marina]
MREFSQVDVFSEAPHSGNPVAVVLDAEGLTTEQMQRFARWTNLSETTFVLPPGAPEADYRVRIFTVDEELPFAGHPTLGTAHAWSVATGNTGRETLVQECGLGNIALRRTEHGLAFAAPELLRSGAVEEATIARIAEVLGIPRTEILDASWADNGPGWVGVLLEDADAVLALRPGDPGELRIGVIAPHRPGGPADYEVRTFLSFQGSLVEDPVTGSFNAAAACWLLGTGRATAPYLARQGTVLDREGRVYVSTGDDGTLWIAGGTLSCVRGTVTF